MAEIKIESGNGLYYECPECGAEVELGQNYCQECGEPIEWKEDYEKYCHLYEPDENGAICHSSREECPEGVHCDAEYDIHGNRLNNDSGIGN